MSHEEPIDPQNEEELDDSYEYLDEEAGSEDATVAKAFKGSLIAVVVIAVAVAIGFFLVNREVEVDGTT